MSRSGYLDGRWVVADSERLPLSKRFVERVTDRTRFESCDRE
jgi:hypothetical protein